MNSHVLRVCYALAIALAAPGVAAARPLSLMESVAAYDAAQVSGDRDALQRLLADDYVLVNSAGKEESRSEFIGESTALDYKLEPFTVLHPIVRTMNDSAIMGGGALLNGHQGSSAFTVCLRFVDVWTRKSGRWQVVYSQAARTDTAACGPAS